MILFDNVIEVNVIEVNVIEVFALANIHPHGCLAPASSLSPEYNSTLDLVSLREKPSFVEHSDKAYKVTQAFILCGRIVNNQIRAMVGSAENDVNSGDSFVIPAFFNRQRAGRLRVS